MEAIIVKGLEVVIMEHLWQNMGFKIYWKNNNFKKVFNQVQNLKLKDQSEDRKKKKELLKILYNI